MYWTVESTLLFSRQRHEDQIFALTRISEALCTLDQKKSSHKIVLHYLVKSRIDRKRRDLGSQSFSCRWRCSAAGDWGNWIRSNLQRAQIDCAKIATTFAQKSPTDISGMLATGERCKTARHARKCFSILQLGLETTKTFPQLLDGSWMLASAWLIQCNPLPLKGVWKIWWSNISNWLTQSMEHLRKFSSKDSATFGKFKRFLYSKSGPTR